MVRETNVSQFLIGGKAREPFSLREEQTWGSSRADGIVRMGEDKLHQAMALENNSAQV